MVLIAGDSRKSSFQSDGVDSVMESVESLLVSRRWSLAVNLRTISYLSFMQWMGDVL